MLTEWQHKAACELLGVEPIVLPGEHCLHVNHPDVLANALERIGNLRTCRLTRALRFGG